jgi:hypothetical protein
MQIVGDVLGGKGEERTARCSDCGEQHQVTQLAWDLAMQFHRALTARGEEGLPGVGRCPKCAEVWRDAQDERGTNRYYRDVELFRRMRRGVAMIESGKATRGQISRFKASLPRDFVTEHEAAVHSFQARCDAAFAKRTSKHDGDDFDGAA